MTKVAQRLVGVDLGGTSVRVSAFEAADPESELAHVSFPISKNGGKFERDIEDLVHAIKEVASGERVGGVGLSIAGNVSDDRTHLTGAGNLTHWIGHRVVEILARGVGCANVVLGNDAEAAALAEATYGDYEDIPDFWFLIWGTGIGGTLVRKVAGKPELFPGEPGHQILDPSSVRECGCGHRGCLESLCGGAGIKQQYGVLPEELGPDEWDEVLGRMARGVYNLLTVQSTRLVVFGGGIAANQPRLVYGLQHRVRHLCHVIEAPDVRVSEFGESAGTIGALALLTLND